MTNALGLAVVVMFAKGQFAIADNTLSMYRADKSAARYHYQLHTELGWPLSHCPAREIFELQEKPAFMLNDAGLLEWIKGGSL
jgi:hypothetical protein